MSLARLYPTKKTRKPFTCSKCRQEIPVGSARISFAVGFRGVEQSRHDTPACAPTRSERESSAYASVYDAIDSFSVDGLSTKDELDEAIQAVADAIEEVRSEYEQNPMYEINEDLQARVSDLESAEYELESWDDSLDEEPEVSEEQPDQDEDPEGYQAWEEAADAHTTWEEEALEAARSAVSGISL